MYAIDNINLHIYYVVPTLSDSRLSAMMTGVWLTIVPHAPQEISSRLQIFIAVTIPVKYKHT